MPRCGRDARAAASLSPRWRRPPASRGRLSLIETGRSDITIGRLNKLSLLYEVKLADLLPEPVHHDSTVVRRTERLGVTSRGEGIDVELLAPEGDRTMNPVLARLAPGGAMEDYVAQPEEDFAIVIEGRARPSSRNPTPSSSSEATAPTTATSAATAG